MSLACHVRARRGAFDLDFGFETQARSVAIVGPSGAGKTTFLQGLAGLGLAGLGLAGLGLAGLGPTEAARLEIDGVALVDTASGLNPPTRRRGLGYVFQDGRLFPHMTVAGNVGFARRHVPDAMPVAEALALVDMAGFEARWPNTLSGGEVRRVAIARALAARPKLLLLDEVFAGIDDARREGLVNVLLRLRDDLGIPLIVVSHDPRDVDALAQATFGIRSGRNDPSMLAS